MAPIMREMAATKRRERKRLQGGMIAGSIIKRRVRFDSRGRSREMHRPVMSMSPGAGRHRRRRRRRAVAQARTCREVAGWQGIVTSLVGARGHLMLWRPRNAAASKSSGLAILAANRHLFKTAASAVAACALMKSMAWHQPPAAALAGFRAGGDTCNHRRRVASISGLLANP